MRCTHVNGGGGGARGHAAVGGHDHEIDRVRLEELAVELLQRADVALGVHAEVRRALEPEVDRAVVRARCSRMIGDY